MDPNSIPATLRLTTLVDFLSFKSCFPNVLIFPIYGSEFFHIFASKLSL